MKILIVEDNEDSRNLLMKQLHACGYEVTPTANGAEALEQALVQSPDIIVSDIMMPKMDGYQLCHEWKQNDKLKDIPFVFYTATYTREEDEKFALSLGAVAFVTKPTELDTFVQMLSEIVEKATSGLQPSAKVAPLEPSLFLAEHDKRIFTKLEDKVAQLEVEITARKQAEEELRKHHKHLEELVKERTSELEEKTAEMEQANIRLQEIDRLKSVFLASMGHELRTPLNSIVGFTGIILQGMSGEVNEEQRQQLTMVRNSASHLMGLIADILDTSRIEAERVELSPEEFSLDDVVREVVETLSTTASEKGLELLPKVPEGITLFSDRRRIKQILMNLVSNAVKFTDQGSVKIAARVLGDDNLEVRVIDTGIGIKEEDMDKLFQPFQQIDVSLTKKHEGTGLWLHLSKKLVTLLGGDISVKSEYGRGSEFAFTIPLRYEEAKRNEKNTGS